MLTPKPRGMKSPIYEPKGHSAKSIRKMERDEAAPVDTGARCYPRGASNCFGDRKPKTGYAAALIYVKVKRPPMPEGMTKHQMVEKLADVFKAFEGHPRVLAAACGWKNVKS